MRILLVYPRLNRRPAIRPWDLAFWESGVRDSNLVLIQAVIIAGLD